MLADLRVPDKKAKLLPALRLTNSAAICGSSGWRLPSGAARLPRGDVELDKPRLHLADGTVRYAEISAYEPSTKTFRLAGAVGSSLAADQIESAVLAPPSDEKPGPITIACRDSSMLSGKLLKVEQNAVWVASPSLREPLRFPAGALRFLVFNVGQRGPSTTPDGARIGMLDCEGVHLSGCLISAVKKQRASCLAWQPLESATGGPLRLRLSGRIQIVRRRPLIPSLPCSLYVCAASEYRRQWRAAMVIVEDGNVRRLVRMNEGNDLKRKALYLMSGDSIPCEVTRIDQKGVSFTSPLSSSTFVPNEKVKVVE